VPPYLLPFESNFLDLRLSGILANGTEKKRKKEEEKGLGGKAHS
jgi:hypothetical protein